MTAQFLHQIDALLSDMAPKLTGIKFRDHEESATLVRQALQLCNDLLRPGGHFVAKIFPGEELAPLKKVLKGCFKQVHEIMPEASRKTSKEIYLVGMNFYTKKGPS